MQVLGTWRGPHATLRFTYGLEFSPCTPCLKCFSREAQTIAQAGTTAKFQQLPGKMQRAVTQVGRLVRSSLNNREDIPRLESGSDPASNRLDAIGFHDPNVQTKSRADFRKSFAEPPGGLPAAHLSSWAYRHIKNRMRSAGGDLLGKDGGHELTLAVEVQRTLNVDEDVIGRAEARSSSPGDAPAFAFDDAAHGRQIEVDRR